MNTFSVFHMNDCDWWIARSLEEAIADYTRECGPDNIDDAHALSEADLDRLQYIEEGHDPSDPSQWKCECGAVGDSNCRWNGLYWEHHHGYPIGHVAMTCTTKRSFREELALQIAKGIEQPRMFATTEY